MSNWILYIDNLNNFINSSKFNIFGIKNEASFDTLLFIREAKQNDLLWLWTFSTDNNIFFQ